MLNPVLEASLWQWDTAQNAWQEINNNDHFYGLLYGYGHYTSFRWPLTNSLWDSHWERLQHDSNALGFQFNIDKTCLYQALESTLKTDAHRVRLSIVPNAKGFGDILQNTLLEPILLLSVHPVAVTNRTPIHVGLASFHRPLPHLKHNQLFDTLHARRQAIQQNNLQDILLTVQREHTVFLTESSTGNIIAIHPEEKRLVTPTPDTTPCLPGITVKHLFHLAEQQHWKTEQKDISLDDLKRYPALMITNAVSGLLPISSIQNMDKQCIWKSGADDNTLLEEILTLGRFY